MALKYDIAMKEANAELSLGWHWEGFKASLGWVNCSLLWLQKDNNANLKGFCETSPELQFFCSGYA